MSAPKDYLQLHFVVFLGSFVPMMALLINLPPVEIVFFRTLIAMILLGMFIYYKHLHFILPRKQLIELLGSGVITSIYWILLLLSAKISTASVCLVGIATSPLWVSFLNPLINKKKFDYLQILTGLTAMFGIYMITSSRFNYGWGLAVSVVAAMFGALLTILNGRLAKNNNHFVITFYQMAGAWLGTTIFLPFYGKYLAPEGLQLNPGLVDMGLIVGMAFVFSIYAYSVFIKVMKKIPAFTVTLAANLSPVYGIITALLVFRRNEVMSMYFYAGALIIIFSVVAYPLVEFINNRTSIEKTKH